jgi:hypothetical protein
MFQAHQPLMIQVFRLLLSQTGDGIDGMVAIHDSDIASSVVMQNACGKYRKRGFADTSLGGSDGEINGFTHIFSFL